MNLFVDLETFSDVDLTKAGLYKYAQSPAFRVLLVAYSFDGGPVKVVDVAQGEAWPQELLGALWNPAVTKHAYNAAFEWYCLSQYFKLSEADTLGWIPQWRDTMLQVSYCGYPNSLDAAGKALGLSSEKQKMSVGKALIRYFCIPCKPTKTNGGRTRNLPQHDPDKWALFKEYNCRDVETEMAIEHRLAAFPVPDELQEQWETDLRINARGVAVDLDLVDGALDIDAAERERLEQEAIRLTGLDNPNSVAQLKDWLEAETGTEVADLRKDTVKDLLGGDIPGDKARRVLEIRQELGKTSTKKYAALETATCADSRVRGILQFYGANRTGRWAGRIVQPQNLPRTYISGELLPLARDLVKARNADALRWIFGSVPDTLSQLIRTALVASSWRVLVDADFSAIEARVLAWLAGENWRLEVFRTHGKIYEASASQMFGVPIEKIKKGNPEYELRQRGKVAELALGYGGGVAAMRQMDTGKILAEVPDSEIGEIVQAWRLRSPMITRLWNDVEDAAASVIQDGGVRWVPAGDGQLTFLLEMADGLTYLTIELPSGRKLYYAEPHMGVNRFGRPAVCYWGVNQTTRKWQPLETYGGKLVENCLAAGTLVLTHDGLKRIEDMSYLDLVWDGYGWVWTGGLIYKGRQRTICVDGLRMTPDHRILTKKGWTPCGQARGSDWAAVRAPDGYLQGGKRLREFLGRHGPKLRSGAGAGQEGQRTRVQPGELPLDTSKKQYAESQKLSGDRHASWKNDRGRVGRKKWDRRNDATLPAGQRMARGIVVDRTERQEHVYDLRDCGERHQFCVYDPLTRRLRIVHNCTQAVARDCLAEAVERLEEAGYPVVFHVHDEVVIDAPTDCLDQVVEIMKENPSWAKGLPLNADGWTDAYYKKE